MQSEAELTLVHSHKQATLPQPLTLTPDVFVHIPPATRLQIPEKLLDVELGIRNTAEAHDRHDAVDALLSHAPGLGQVLNAVRHNLIRVLQAGGRGVLAQRGVDAGVGLDAEDPGDPPARGVDLGEHRHPHPRARPNLDYRAADALVLPLLDDVAAGDVAFQQGDHAGLASLPNARAGCRPEGAEPGGLELRGGEQRGELALEEQAEDRGGEYQEGLGHEDPRVDEEPEYFGERGHGGQV